MNPFLLVFCISSIHVLDDGFVSHNIPCLVVVIWTIKADRLFPCWCWLKLTFNSCMMRIEWIWHVVKYLRSAVNLSLCMFSRSKIPYCCQLDLILYCWVDLLKNDYLALCFFIRTGRSLLSKKIASLLGFQVGVYIMVGHCFKILVYDWNWL